MGNDRSCKFQKHLSFQWRRDYNKRTMNRIERSGKQTYGCEKYRSF